VSVVEHIRQDTPEADAIYSQSALFIAREMMSDDVLMDGTLLRDLWSEQERELFAATHPAEWAQAANERR
jgi:hypothetical protein